MNIKSVVIAAVSFLAGVAVTLAVTKMNLGNATTEIAFGNNKSSVVLTEYASLGCSHCAQFHKEIFPKVHDELVKTGKVKYVFKPFPGNPVANKGAALLFCAPAGKKIALLDKLYQEQRNWLRDESASALKQLASGVGIDEEEFTSCVSKQETYLPILAGHKTEAMAQGVRGTPSFTINGQKLEGVSSAEGLIAAVNDVTAGKPANATLKEKAAEVMKVTSQDRIFGQPDAPVTIIEYASLSCPHCAKFHNEVFPVVKKEFIDTGKVKWVYRHYPLNAPALTAAMLVECSKDPQATLSSLFKTQKDWAFSKEGVEQSLISLSGLSQNEAKACLANKDIEKNILKTQMQGAGAGVSSTPSFYINGEKADHLHSFDEFKAAIR